MSRLRQFDLATVGAVLLALSVVVSCSRSASDVTAAKSDQRLGDNEQAGSASVGSASAGSASAGSEVPEPQRSEGKLLPSSASRKLTVHPLTDHASRAFTDFDILPAGTLLTVRLEKSLAADAPEAGGGFDAIVDEAVVVNGVTIIPQGVSVAGRVEAARASALKRSRAYLRLTLASIEVGGRDLAVQTSSLFARGRSDATSILENANSISAASSISLVNSVHLEKGRQLTFRLIGPVAIPAERSVAAR